MKIKVCGNTVLEQLKELSNLPIDYVGLIFYPQSPRCVLQKIKANDFKQLKIPATKVGVFVNASEEEIMKQVEEFGLEMVQLHGDETASFCNKISDQLKVIKAFRITDIDANVDWLVQEYDEVCDYYLFDKGSAGLYGGTGKKFDWDLLRNSAIKKPFFLPRLVCVSAFRSLRSLHFSNTYSSFLNFSSPLIVMI